VHVEVLRVGRSRHEQEHLAELERVGLALHLNAKEKRAAAAASRCQLIFVAIAVATVSLSIAPRCFSRSPDLEVTRDKDEDTGGGLCAVDGLDGVLDGLERQTDELLNDRLGAAESLALERQQRGGLLWLRPEKRGEREMERAVSPTDPQAVDRRVGRRSPLLLFSLT